MKWNIHAYVGLVWFKLTSTQSKDIPKSSFKVFIIKKNHADARLRGLGENLWHWNTRTGVRDSEGGTKDNGIKKYLGYIDNWLLPHPPQTSRQSRFNLLQLSDCKLRTCMLLAADPWAWHGEPSKSHKAGSGDYKKKYLEKGAASFPVWLR